MLDKTNDDGSPKPMPASEGVVETANTCFEPQNIKQCQSRPAGEVIDAEKANEAIRIRNLLDPVHKCPVITEVAYP